MPEGNLSESANKRRRPADESHPGATGVQTAAGAERERDLPGKEFAPSRWSALSDAQLVHEVRSGQLDAFGELVRRYERRLQRTIFRLSGDAEWSRDLAQETFLRVFERLDRFDTSQRFGPWLFRIGVNLAVDGWRRRRKRPVVVVGDMDAHPAVPQSEDPRRPRELAEEVQAVLEQLGTSDRTVLALRDLEGFTCSEIAAILRRRESTIRWRLCKARERFRRIWETRQQAQEEGSPS